MYEKNPVSMGRPLPMVSRTFLPRCPKCHASHPLARKGYKGDPDTCPDCGEPSATPGETHTQVGVLGGGILGFIARICLGFGAWLAKLAERI